jgi:iron complex outermembrane receptor protein
LIALPGIGQEPAPVIVTFTDLQEEQPEDADVEPPDEAQLPPGLPSLEEFAEQPFLVPALAQEVTTVSRQESTVGKSPAAVFVVTQEMIRRSGATSIPEVLRMVPGLQVARIDSNKWSVTSRGFGDRFFNRFLLVQIDGRAVYQLINSTVSWDATDVMLEDVERIEVVRGPGASVWGANAVNGIINIITKSAADTQGGLVASGGGTEERGFSSVRYGGGNGCDFNYRVYGKWFDRDNGFNPNGNAHDDWRAGRGGFRMDWNPTCCDTVTLQGEIFEVHSGRRDFLRPLTADPFFFTNTEDEITDGGHLLSRWSRDLGDDSGWSLQMYYDRFDRRSTNQIIHASIDTYDVDFQRHFPLGCNHQLVWGAGYRFYDIHFRPSGFDGGFHVNASDETVDLNRVSAFVQDEMTLTDELFLTMGVKLSHNDFSNFEYQPTARLLWTPYERSAAWASFSRAVRTPAYAEHFSQITGVAAPGGAFFTAFPNQDFDSEEMFAYELGYRAQPIDTFSWDLALFYHKYDELLVRRVSPPPFIDPTTMLPVFPISTFNGMDGETYGVELAGTWDVTDCWRLYAQYTFLQMQLHADNPADAASEPATEDLSPQNQVYLMSSWDVGCNWEVDLIGRYVDVLPQFVDVPSYLAWDLRVAWNPQENLELSVVGQNLTDTEHPEFGATGGATLRSPTVEMQRGVYGMVRYRW